MCTNHSKFIPGRKYNYVTCIIHCTIIFVFKNKKKCVYNNYL